MMLVPTSQMLLHASFSTLNIFIHLHAIIHTLELSHVANFGKYKQFLRTALVSDMVMLYRLVQSGNYRLHL